MPVRLVSDEQLPGPLQGYRLIDRLGRGGFGEVWRAEAPGGIHKAIKFVFGDLDSADEDGRPAEQELKALNRVKSIRHPYVLSLERFDVVDGQLIIVMELADRNLWDRFRECRTKGLPGVPRAELLQYMEEAAEALDLMNDGYQIQHLDVKPQNIFLSHNHVKVADFGLAKLFEGDRGTVTGGVTPVYAAPETFEGWVSRFTDQYSLAIVFQEMLTGVRPFTGANTKQLLLQHINGTPDLSPLPAADRAAVARGLNKQPDARWASCGELVRALRAAEAGRSPGAVAAPARPTSDTPRPGDRGPGVGTATVPQPGRSGVQTNPNRRPGPAAEAESGPVTAVMPRAAAGAAANPFGPGLVAPGLVTPGLVTPRLVTPQAAAAGPSSQLLSRPRPGPAAAAPVGATAPPEKAGDGVLFPALVVGVGQTGLDVLRTLRGLIRDRFGAADAVPTVRFLYVDTDPDAVAAAGQGADPFAAREVLLARLNRPAHYLQQTGPQSVEAWLPAGALYRLPKTPGPAAGVRAFGRLALADHAQAVARRVRQEVEPFLTDAALDQAAADTGLGVRSNRVRAYVVAGLAGGTGSGMAADLGYLIQHELRAAGYAAPEAVGVLLVPPADPKAAGVANTYAALAEIRHYAAGGRYHARLDRADPPPADGAGAFARCAVVQLPAGGKEPARGPAVGLAARGVFTDLFTPAGRVADYVRSVTPVAPGAAAAVAHVSGLFRLSWPRAGLLAAAGRRFAEQLLRRWAGKEAGHLRGPIQDWLADQWAKLQLDPDAVVARFEQAARDALREDPTSVFEAAVDTLRTRTPGSRVDAAVACGVFEQLLKLVGKPEGEGEAVGSLEDVARGACKAFAAEVEAHLATVAVSFIEQPQYRLAGAEEALAQATDRVKAAADALDGRRAGMAHDVKESYARLFQIIGGLGSTGGLAAIAGRRAALAAELHDALAAYATRRYRLVVVDAALSLYRGLLTNIPDYLRDVSHCRTRLDELARQAGGGAAAAPDPAAEAFVLPAGCATVDEAADRFLAALPAEDLLAFDQAVQERTVRKFRGVANVCLKPDRSAPFLALLHAEAGAFLDARLGAADPAAALLEHAGEDADVRRLLAAGFAKAAPAPAPTAPSVEAAVLAAPAGPAGDRLRRLAAAACPGVEFIPAPLPDGVMICREFPRVDLAALPQLGPKAREAYDAALAADRSPHARADVGWTTPAPP